MSSETLLHCDAEIRRRGCYSRLVGVDEAGRGPLAGPVVAAACYIPAGVYIEGIDDSKKLTARRRSSLYELLTSHPAIDYGIGIVSPADIDILNIYQATLRAMSEAVAALSLPPDYLLVDGNVLPKVECPATFLIGGDGLSYLIAAASILAKEFRDRHMALLHEQWPHYGFFNHKGYGTKAHLAALQQHGPSPCHRRSFAPVRNSYKQ